MLLSLISYISANTSKKKLPLLMIHVSLVSSKDTSVVKQMTRLTVSHLGSNLD
jgi:hypothetical protein